MNEKKNLKRQSRLVDDAKFYNRVVLDGNRITILNWCFLSEIQFTTHRFNLKILSIMAEKIFSMFRVRKLRELIIARRHIKNAKTRRVNNRKIRTMYVYCSRKIWLTTRIIKLIVLCFRWNRQLTRTKYRFGSIRIIGYRIIIEQIAYAKSFRSGQFQLISYRLRVAVKIH